ncbi:MAG: polysaccharide deacetylase family protein [Candidatus Krumholzibacteriia bacterium]
MYHEVLPDDHPVAAWTVVRASQFRAQMEFLKRHFDCVSIDDARERLSPGRRLARPLAVVTFDDGYAGNLQQALPILADLGIPAHFYVATQSCQEQSLFWYDRIIGLLGLERTLTVDLREHGFGEFRLNSSRTESGRWEQMQRLLEVLKTMEPAARMGAVDSISADVTAPIAFRMMTAAEIAELSRSPLASVGGHSHTHDILVQLDDAAVRTTLQVNRSLLEHWCGVPVTHFSYPNGDTDRRIAGIVKELGFASAVTTRPGIWSAASDPHRLPRQGIGRFATVRYIQARLAGLV